MTVHSKKWVKGEGRGSKGEIAGDLLFSSGGVREHATRLLFWASVVKRAAHYFPTAWGMGRGPD